MSVTFESGATQLTLRDPEYLNSEVSERQQSLGRTASGVVYVYDKGVEVRMMRLAFRYFDQSEKDGLEDFYRNTVEGALSSFTYTDHRSRVWTARFMDAPEFSEALSDKWHCEVLLEVVAT